jgi:hypothetical protein
VTDAPRADVDGWKATITRGVLSIRATGGTGQALRHAEYFALILKDERSLEDTGSADGP